ncbi:MAG TPA: hypothetical protein VI750_14510 [Pyrinomonadaceae bacterium]|nr:hypothetical protein [Pyrinomonadaceae bacterium]
MTNTSYSFDNLNDGNTLSGLSYDLVDAIPMEMYREVFMDVVDEDRPLAEKLLREMTQLEYVGDFISEETQLLEFAVFGLILMDRLVRNFEDKQDGWKNMLILHEMIECAENIYLPDPRIVRRNSARKAAEARHKENRDFKREVIAYYTAHQREFKSMDAAAEAIVSKVKLVPVTFRTVRDWIGEHRKQLQSARKA